MDDAGFNLLQPVPMLWNAEQTQATVSRSLDLVTPGEVDTHALADEEGRQRHVDVPRGVATSLSCHKLQNCSTFEKDKTHDSGS